jgi:hypothetical protein
VHGVHADQLGAVLQVAQAQRLQAVFQHGQRQFAARAGAGAGIGDLAFADEALAIAQRGLQVRGAGVAGGACHLHAVGA